MSSSSRAGGSLVATNLNFTYPAVELPFTRKRPNPQVLKDVSLRVEPGRTMGLVGESGCGKSTLVALLCGDTKPSSGTITIDGVPLGQLTEPSRRPLARRMQVVSQDPISTFDPRQTIGKQILEALHIHQSFPQSEWEQRTRKALSEVALPLSAGDRYPHQLSGGQRQRVAIARALVVEPEILLCDEPVSALDVSIQAQVLNLLLDLQRVRSMSMLFISHDIRVIKHMSHDIAVMQGGVIVESGDNETVLAQPKNPYTVRLLSAVPKGRRKPT